MAEFDLSGVNLPYNLDAEQSVLGAILMDGGAINEVMGNAPPRAFPCSS